MGALFGCAKLESESELPQTGERAARYTWPSAPPALYSSQALVRSQPMCGSDTVNDLPSGFPKNDLHFYWGLQYLGPKH